MDEMFPSPEELFGDIHWIPKDVVDQLRERYAAHGPEYLGPNSMPDGRRINLCMERNSAQDALEEVIDAIFNLLVLRFKGKHYTGPMRNLLSAYSSLKVMRDYEEIARASV